MTELDRCWKNCLRMWKWIANKWKRGDDIEKMKSEWLKLHRFRPVYNGCFFCAYTTTNDCEDCDLCPGYLVNKRFHCCNETYFYSRHPKAFYRKLLALDKKRRQK